MPPKAKTASATKGDVPKVGDRFVYRGNAYTVVSVDATGFTIQRPDDEMPQPGYLRLVSGNTADVRYAEDLDAHYLVGSVAPSMRGQPVADLQRVLDMTRLNGGRDDIAIATHYGAASPFTAKAR